jgi:hypothetical protein
MNIIRHQWYVKSVKQDGKSRMRHVGAQVSESSNLPTAGLEHQADEATCG